MSEHMDSVTIEEDFETWPGSLSDHGIHLQVTTSFGQCTFDMGKGKVNILILNGLLLFLSAFLQNCFLCWDRWNSDVMPTLDAALLLDPFLLLA